MAISIIQDEIVRERVGISMEELVNIITIAEMTLRPVGLNLYTFAGTKIDGFVGGPVKTLGFYLCLV